VINPNTAPRTRLFEGVSRGPFGLVVALTEARKTIDRFVNSCRLDQLTCQCAIHLGCKDWVTNHMSRLSFGGDDNHQRSGDARIENSCQ